MTSVEMRGIKDEGVERPWSEDREDEVAPARVEWRFGPLLARGWFSRVGHGGCSWDDEVWGFVLQDAQFGERRLTMPDKNVECG